MLHKETRKIEGYLYLVGAGPGDPELITVKGLQCLRQAEVLIYDRLVASELLDETPVTAERIYVGKEPEKHLYSQAEINALIIEKVREGKIVVRLKGGDPFLFGRGGEEAEACAQAGVAFEVVPGVSSALAVPAYAGIPITYRGKSSSVAIVTGHEDPTKPQSHVNWESLAKMDTLIILMGLRKLPEIVDQLVLCGRAPETPVATIEWGTRLHQRVTVGTLANIIVRVKRAELRSPAITVIGKVVCLRDTLDWFGKHPVPD